jgi:hypothetical protein
MKKIILLFVTLFLLHFIGISQMVRIKSKGGKSFCGFNIKNGFYYNSQSKSYITKQSLIGDESGIADVVAEIEKTLGFDVEINVFIAKDEENCFATIGEDGMRLIIADQLFLNKVNKSSNTQWAAISIIAHEIGHHIAGFTRRESQLESELDADYWSGFTLQKLGASKDAAIKCIMTFGSDQDSKTHPNKNKRASIILQGWNDGFKGDYDNDRCENCK